MIQKQKKGNRCRVHRAASMLMVTCSVPFPPLSSLVHADPHEGNLMLGDDGRLYFLDFGLMSEVR